jgi:thiol-disulfide isomerase/thioredoxin
MTFGRIALTLFALATFACDAPTPEPSPDPAASAGATKSAGALPELVHLPAGTTDLAAFFKAERERGQRDGKKVMVYVGADWCEPCRRFKEAVQDGLLDRELADVRILVTDLDVDGPALERAGCGSKLVPLFARPSHDGTCSTKRTEGGIKGEGAVPSMLPRIKGILVGD